MTSPANTVPDSVNTSDSLPLPLSYAAVYVLLPSVNVIPAPDERLLSSSMTHVRVTPSDATDALRTTGAPEGAVTVLTGAIVSILAIFSSPVIVTLLPGAVDSLNAGTKALPTGTDR